MGGSGDEFAGRNVSSECVDYNETRSSIIKGSVLGRWRIRVLVSLTRLWIGQEKVYIEYRFWIWQVEFGKIGLDKWDRRGVQGETRSDGWY